MSDPLTEALAPVLELLVGRVAARIVELQAEGE
jgi:hypothetical protein